MNVVIQLAMLEPLKPFFCWVNSFVPGSVTQGIDRCVLISSGISWVILYWMSLLLLRFWYEFFVALPPVPHFFNEYFLFGFSKVKQLIEHMTQPLMKSLLKSLYFLPIWNSFVVDLTCEHKLYLKETDHLLIERILHEFRVNEITQSHLIELSYNFKWYIAFGPSCRCVSFPPRRSSDFGWVSHSKSPSLRLWQYDSDP